MLWPLCLLLQQVQGGSELSRAGIISGSVIGTAGQNQILTSIGQPYAAVSFQGDTSAGGAGLLAGLENSPISDLAGQLKGIEDELLVMTHAQLLSLLNAYDPDGDAITLVVEPLAGTVKGVAGAGSMELNDGESVSWQPPLHKNGAIEALRVTLHDSRLAKETVALITVNIDPGMDIVSPVLTLLGEVQLTIDQGTTYVDAGASATDNADGDLTAKIVVSGEVDASTVGTHTLKYDVSDAAGNAAESVSRTVVVQKTSVTQTLSLIEGWNLISFYVEADDMRPATVLAPIKGNLVLIKDLKNSYKPKLPAFINTLKVLNVKDGYWVKMNAGASFELEGSVPAGASIPVESGWNLVGYPRESGEAPADELESLGDTVLRFKNLKVSYNPALPAFINTLKVITPGLGYWLMVSENGVWNVGDVSGDGGNRDISKMGQDESRWGPVVVYPNVSATVLAEVTVEGKAVTDGSVVGAFVGDELRGQHEVVLGDGKSYVTINVNLPEAEKVSFRIWDAGSDREYVVTKSMTLEMGEMYGSVEALVKLDGVASGSDSTIRIVGYDREPFGFEFESQMGSSYVVETTDDLKDWGTLKSYNGTGTLIRFEDERDHDPPQWFYRVKVVE